jgi:hypothetical protein
LHAADYASVLKLKQKNKADSYAMAHSTMCYYYKNKKTERGGSVSGVPWQMAMKGGRGRWWCGVDKVVMMVGLCVRKHKLREGLGYKSPKTKHSGLVSAMQGKQRWRAMGGGGGMMWIRWWWWWGYVFANVGWAKGQGPKNPKTEHSGSVSAVPWQMAAQGDGGRC